MARRRLGRLPRLLFVCSLLAFTAASGYTAVDLLTHITPALFPGKVLADAPGIGDLIDRVPIKAPAIEDTVFGQRVNLLIIGVDRRPGLEDAPPEVRFDGNTDTLMVASLDPVGKSVSFLSFPRDMVIDVSRPNERPTRTASTPPTTRVSRMAARSTPVHTSSRKTCSATSASRSTTTS
jgi:anionic cell wall polymer biosynthesis LytR-Cps2A-Psr (LCP) family protein